MAKSWEERFYEDLLPEIETYSSEEASSFTSNDIADRLDEYSPQKVGKALRHMVEKEGTDHILMTGNAPKTWEAVLLNGKAWERIEYRLDVEPQRETPEDEEIAEKILEENPTAKEEGLYSGFINRLREYDRFNNAAESIEKMRDVADRRRPEIDPEIQEIGAQEYGKLRRNIDDVYTALEEIKTEKSGLFRTKHLEAKVENVRASEIGIVLSGLAAAGLIENYSDRKGYIPDSIELESIQEFTRAVKHAESIENLQDFLEFSENDR